MRSFHYLTVKKSFLALLASIVFLSSCIKNDNNSITTTSDLKSENGKLATDWVVLSLTLTKEAPGYTSPVAARTFAYLSLGMYELLVPGMPEYSSMQGKLNGFNRGAMPNTKQVGEISWNLSLNEGMYKLYKYFYRNSSPASLSLIDKLHQNNLDVYSKGLTTDVISNSLTYGNAHAEALLKYAETDGQAEAFLNNYPDSYKTPNGQGLWVPLNNQIKKPLQPYWGNVRTFLSYSIQETDMIAPPEYSNDKTSVMYAYAVDVRNKVENLTKEEEVMVRFWNDEQEHSITPAGHMMSVLAQVLKEEGKDLGFCAYAFMKLGITLHDATVMAWKTKYKYNTVRPESYIKSNIDNEFIALVNATPTPEYSSSPSAIASAAVEVLGNLFGYSYAFTDRTYEYRKDIDGSPRSFKSFQHMSKEVSDASLFGGIHYRFSLEAGEKQGISVGKNINSLR
jgi:hypothetical protein